MSTEIDDQIESLKCEIEAANDRCDVAWEAFDIDAYERACESGNRAYRKLELLIAQREEA